jgi:hypothetical protein
MVQEEEVSGRCPECDAEWKDGRTCQDHFHQMLAWEWEDTKTRFGIHHLMVLSYHLQHPSLYSPAGLALAKQLLADFLTAGLTPAEARRRNDAAPHSGRREFKIKGTPAAHGAYDRPVPWTMRAPDVTAGDAGAYGDSVQAWARSIHEALLASGNL